jgi:hypothetical protein
MKTAITVTIDLECMQYLNEKTGKKSHYINQLIISDMQSALEKKKKVWLKCPDCNLAVIDGEMCLGCKEVVMAQQTLEEFA